MHELEDVCPVAWPVAAAAAGVAEFPAAGVKGVLALATRRDDEVLAADLLAVAEAAGERLRSLAGQSPDGESDACRQRLVQAATAAIAAGQSLMAVADAELLGERRARAEVSVELLRRAARASERKRRADEEYEGAVTLSARVGLGCREIAGAVGVSHGTIRAIVARTDAAHASENGRPAALGDGGGKVV